jgi:hypothetical protein
MTGAGVTVGAAVSVGAGVAVGGMGVGVGGKVGVGVSVAGLSKFQPEELPVCPAALHAAKPKIKNTHKNVKKRLLFI